MRAALLVSLAAFACSACVGLPTRVSPSSAASADDGVVVNTDRRPDDALYQVYRTMVAHGIAIDSAASGASRLRARSWTSGWRYDAGRRSERDRYAVTAHTDGGGLVRHVVIRLGACTPSPRDQSGCSDAVASVSAARRAGARVAQEPVAIVVTGQHPLTRVAAATAAKVS